MGAIYRDPDTGQSVATHSMLKTFRRCPKQFEYKYIMRLQPKMTAKPLRRGTWIHKLLEVHYKGGDWRAEHQRLSAEFNRLFDEEKDELGNLPVEIKHIMESYFWHYAQHDWKVHEVEFTLECELPDGTLYRCKIDLLVEDQYGLWIVDHKSHARLPDLSYRILDAQSGLYIWNALKNKIPVQGHIWNYVRWKMPTVPHLNKDGTLSRRSIETDYLTFGRALKRYGTPLSDHQRTLKMLKGRQYRHGEPQTSPFFRRDVLEKSNDMVRRIAQEGYHSARRMIDYPWDRRDAIERVPDRSCSFACSFTDLCSLELFGGNIQPLLKRFKVGDPLDYYQDDRGEFDNRGSE